MSTILIVDDEPTVRETLLAMLEGQGYAIAEAVNGPEAIQKAGELRPDLILLDVMMPGMDGYEVCRRIRSTPDLAEVPIVILTALDDRASLLRGIESGADDILTKPVDRQELRARARTITRLNRYQTLMEQREELRRMAGHIIRELELERGRISRELHDDIGQALTTHMLDIRSLQDDLSIPIPELFERLQVMYQQSYETSVKLRRLAQDMRPPVLDALGLRAAMESYCADFSRRANLPITFECDSSLPVLPDTYTITLYRAMQEALNNIAKHARATHAWTSLTVEDRTITLIVQDNGIGFDAERAKFGGIGLTGMRERLEIAGGNFQITSNSTRGTILTAQLPLPDEAGTQEEAE